VIQRTESKARQRETFDGVSQLRGYLDWIASPARLSRVGLRASFPSFLNYGAFVGIAAAAAKS
jgi:hypothetical protein